MTQTAKRILKKSIQFFLIGLIFYFLADQLVEKWEEVRAYQWQLNYWYLTAATILAVFSLFLFSSIWRLIILSLGNKVGYKKAFKIAFLSNLGRYIPGKFWQVLGVVYLAKREGIAEEAAVASFGMTQVFSIPSALMAAVICLSLYPKALFENATIPYMASGVIIIGSVTLLLSLLVVFSPRLTESLFNRVLKLLRRNRIEIRINKSLAAAIYGGYFLTWTVYGLAFWLFIKGITIDPVSPIPMVGIFIMSYQIGYLVLFAPGGVGPREGIMGLMLAPFVGPAALAIPIAARIWSIVTETIAALIAWRIK